VSNFLDGVLMDALAQVSKMTSELPENKQLWTYTIRGFDGSPYITRTMLPRVGDLRTIIHKIHRADADPHMHNHPWATARFLILNGGYTEEREIPPIVPGACGGLQITQYRPGDVNYINANDYHRVVDVEPETWTLGIVGDRIQDWGFMAKGVHVPHAEYFARKGHFISKSDGKS